LSTPLDARDIDAITLSYTFFPHETEKPVAAVAEPVQDKEHLVRPTLFRTGGPGREMMTIGEKDMADAHQKHHDYHIIDPSPWPLVGSIGRS
jgi:hypothetical protein